MVDLPPHARPGGPRDPRRSATPLKRAWAKNLGAAVYGEPLVVGSTLIVATERNRVFGLNARTGHVRWQTGLGHAAAA